jgi:uncharacterized membrane protein YeaQ/YmgE (transglycosylase-associated protein family)
MFVRILIWAVTIGFLGAVVTDYSTYDTTSVTTTLGALFGALVGAGIGLFIHRRQRSKGN